MKSCLCDVDTCKSQKCLGARIVAGQELSTPPCTWRDAFTDCPKQSMSVVGGNRFKSCLVELLKCIVAQLHTVLDVKNKIHKENQSCGDATRNKSTHRTCLKYFKILVVCDVNTCN